MAIRPELWRSARHYIDAGVDPRTVLLWGPAIARSRCSAGTAPSTSDDVRRAGQQATNQGSPVASSVQRAPTMRSGGSGAEGSRTLDLLNAIQALSQLSYGPTRGRKPSRDALIP